MHNEPEIKEYCRGYTYRGPEVEQWTPPLRSFGPWYSLDDILEPTEPPEPTDPKVTP